ncbi:MAG: hypothetical protein ACRD2C_17030 [Acidimicrobiales bacterium]
MRTRPLTPLALIQVGLASSGRDSAMARELHLPSTSRVRTTSVSRSTTSAKR